MSVPLIKVAELLTHDPRSNVGGRTIFINAVDKMPRLLDHKNEPMRTNIAVTAVDDQTSAVKQGVEVSTVTTDERAGIAMANVASFSTSQKRTHEGELTHNRPRIKTGHELLELPVSDRAGIQLTHTHTITSAHPQVLLPRSCLRSAVCTHSAALLKTVCVDIGS